MKFRAILLTMLLFCCTVIYSSTVLAQDEGVPNIKLGSEFSNHRKARRGANTPTSGTIKESSSLGRRILLYLPNRFLDLLDIFRVDGGIGPAVGGVVRITKYGQAGYRTMDPGSVRIGLMGRREPFMWEEADEYGIGPNYHESTDREVNTLEVGVGVDCVAGAYLGIDLYEIPDFFLGWFGVDYSDDDLS